MKIRVIAIRFLVSLNKYIYMYDVYNDKYNEMYKILGYSNRQLVAMVGHLDKTLSSAGIWGDFAPGY